MPSVPLEVGRGQVGLLNERPMPDSVVVQCKECKLFQVIPQLLPVKDGAYFNCDNCPAKKTGEPSRQPCVVQKMPDGKVLRSYDVEEMRKQAKKLNASGTSERQDARMSSQKSRILHTLEEQRLRRIQARAHHAIVRPGARGGSPCARATDQGEVARRCYHREDARRARAGEHGQSARGVANSGAPPLTSHMGMWACMSAHGAAGPRACC